MIVVDRMSRSPDLVVIDTRLIAAAPARFLRSIGLPTSLADLGVTDATDTEIEQITRRTMTAPHLANVVRPVDQAMIVSAIRQVGRLAA